MSMKGVNEGLETSSFHLLVLNYLCKFSEILKFQMFLLIFALDTNGVLLSCAPKVMGHEWFKKIPDGGATAQSVTCVAL